MCEISIQQRTFKERKLKVKTFTAHESISKSATEQNKYFFYCDFISLKFQHFFFSKFGLFLKKKLKILTFF